MKNFLFQEIYPIDNFAVFRPWAVAVMLSVIEYQRLGMQPELGVDQHFRKLALTNGKELGQLETVDEQITFLQSMENIDPGLMVGHTLRDLEKLPVFIDEMKTGWRTGDIESFTKNSMIIQMKSEFPKLYNTLLVNRNNNWMPQISNLVSDDEREFVLVGAMHLNSEEGLLN